MSVQTLMDRSTSWEIGRECGLGVYTRPPRGLGLFFPPPILLETRMRIKCPQVSRVSTLRILTSYSQSAGRIDAITRIEPKSALMGQQTYAGMDFITGSMKQ